MYFPDESTLVAILDVWKVSVIPVPEFVRQLGFPAATDKLLAAIA